MADASKTALSCTKKKTSYEITTERSPSGLKLKLAYFFSKRIFGKVIAALKCIYSRSAPIMMASLKIMNVENRLSLPKRPGFLFAAIRLISMIARFAPTVSNIFLRKTISNSCMWKEFMNFRNSEKFSEKEKALLAYLEEINATKSQTDETFCNLKEFYSDNEIVEITWINVTKNYFNLMAKPLGLTSNGLNFVRKKPEKI